MTRVTPNTLTPLNYLRQAPRLTRKKPLRPITSETERWAPDLDIVSPIASESIPGFRAWVNWAGFKTVPHRWQQRAHLGVDFTAFVNDKDQVVLGLPPETEVRAVADGIVFDFYAHEKVPHPYLSEVTLVHKGKHALRTEYAHVIPSVEPGQQVEKGETIGTLYKDAGTRRGRMVHLHFTMGDPLERDFWIDPVKIYPELFPLTADPFGGHRFRLLETGLQPDIVTANFRKVITRYPKVLSRALKVLTRDPQE